MTDLTWSAALLAAVVAGLGGLGVPALLAVLPEPGPSESEPQPTDSAEAEDLPTDSAEAEDPGGEDPGRGLFGGLAASPTKIPYVDLARAPHLASWCALLGALFGGVSGLLLGWSWPLAYLIPLIPVGLALAYVDLRVWLLPTVLIWPSWALAFGLIVIGWPVTGSPSALVHALIGSVLYWAYLAVFWFLGGMGFGDVRLAALLGLVLGSVGWPALVVGAFAGFVLGAVGWIPLRLLRISRSRNLPFGPFLLLGALIGLWWGETLLPSLA